MNLIIKSSFYKDIKKIDDKVLKNQIEEIINNIEEVKEISDIINIKKLSGYKSYYRIKHKDYRIGLFYETDIIYLVCFKHRKDIYKSFP